MQLVAIRVGGIQMGLDADRVERVLPAFALEPAPRGPEILMGIANLAGSYLAAVDLKRRLEGVPTALRPDLAFVVMRSGRRPLILVADAVLGLVDGDPADFVPIDSVAPGLGPVKGLLRGADGGVWIQDPERFLSWEEEAGVDAAVREAAERDPALPRIEGPEA